MTTPGRVICMVLVLCGLLIAPALAGTQYVTGSPDLSANISGTNEFSPGDEVLVPVIITNRGTSDYKYVQTNTIDRPDLPTTAKFLTASLLSGDAPVIIRSDPQMVGDLGGPGTASAVFTVRIKTDAPAGTYHLPLMLNYSYLYSADQYAIDTMEYRYNTENITIAIPLSIKPDVSIDVVSARPEHLNAGTDGYIFMKIKNTGFEDGAKSIVILSRNADSPIVPVDSSVYIGDFPANSTVDCRYKVSVSGDAENQTYPVDVAVVYENRDGDLVTSRKDTVGLPVGGKTDFAIVSMPAEMNPGNRKIVSVEYQNTGDTTVYSAQARISAVDPFTSNDDIAYIGDLMPGDSKNITYTISVDRSATIKQYGLDSEIRYRDALDNTYISDPMKLKVNVTAPSPFNAILSNPIYLSIILAVIIGIIYIAYQYRRKQ
jgi:hypothetical protein